MGHTFGNSVAHSWQNFAEGWFSCWQLGQRMAFLSNCRQRAQFRPHSLGFDERTQALEDFQCTREVLARVIDAAKSPKETAITGVGERQLALGLGLLEIRHHTLEMFLSKSELAISEQSLGKETLSGCCD